MLVRFLRFFFCLCIFISIPAFSIQGSPPNAKDEPGSSQSLTLIGDFKQGTLLLGSVDPGYEVYLEGRQLRVTPEGRFVIGFGRDAKLSQTIKWGLQGNYQSKVIQLAKRQYNIQRIKGVPQSTVSPPTGDLLDRIIKETALVKAARKTDSNSEYFLNDFIVPVDGRITGVYGSQRVYNGTPKRPHYGIDYAAPTGTIVKAPAAGIVTLVHPDMFYSGGTLIVDHGYGVSSTFIHLSEVIVKEGQKVSKGDPIAKVGAGGRATGPHLDWRVNWYDVRVDPGLVLELAKYKKN